MSLGRFSRHMSRVALWITVIVALAGLLALAGLRPRKTGSAPTRDVSPAQTKDSRTLKKATFAAGCFWGVEATFRKLDGVVATEVGYTGGRTDAPTYDEVCTHTTGHAEAVRVTYDPARISYPELLDAFWSCHDPTWDASTSGGQYRSGIFFHDAGQERLARQSLAEVEASGVFTGKPLTEISPAGHFFPAEDYHQQYYDKRGLAESCHVGAASVHTQLAAAGAKERAGAAR